jgi:putative peptidoglycan lipid II flippase
MFRHFDVTGLAMASDIGILLQTVMLAWLLSRKKLVELRGLPWWELMKALATAILAGVLGYAVARRVVVHGNWETDVQSLMMIGLTWLAAIVIGLWVTRSRLWSELRRRKQPTQVVEPRAVTERTEGGAQP